jgi:adenylate kinase family enzyme
MKTKKEQKTPAKNNPQNNVVSLSALEKLRLVLDFKPSSGQVLYPMLIGATGTGKSESAKQIANDYKLPFVTLLLHSMLSEEIAGIPVVQNNKTTWSDPEWFSQEKMLLFIDEIDKVRNENVATILTLLASRELRGKKLHPETKIILAGQPGIDNDDETWKALISRTVPIKWNDGISYFRKKYNADLTGLLEEEEFDVPKPILNNRQMEYIIQFSMQMPDQAREIFGYAPVDEILKRINEAVVITPEDVFMKYEDLLVKPDIYFLINHFPSAFISGSGKTFKEVLYRIITEGTKDEINSFIQRMSQWLEENNGKEMEIRMTEEEYSESVSALCEELIKYKEGKEKSK